MEVPEKYNEMGNTEEATPHFWIMDTKVHVQLSMFLSSICDHA
jgi:hypothetical protein